MVNQSIWFEGEAKFADIMLPACTNFERWDIGEACNAGGYAGHNFTKLNHRVIHMQHKCIEPLGESKSDYEIFLELSKRSGLSAYYSEGMTEFDWCKRLFDATDLPKVVSWKEFLKKGYYVVPAPKENSRALALTDGLRKAERKTSRKPRPCLRIIRREYLMGLQTHRETSSLNAQACNDSIRVTPKEPTISKYIPSWEGPHTKDLSDKYPFQLISPHPRFSYHTHMDGKDSFVNDVKDHRILINGYYYWIVRINTKDARDREIRRQGPGQNVNDRGAVILAVQVTERVRHRTVHS